jgi:hypothetical protein
MKHSVLNILFIALLVSCGGGSEDSPLPSPLNPESTTLLFPDKDSGCTTGTNVTTAKSTIVFKWNTSPNTDSYEVTLKDMKSGTTTKHASTINQLSLELSRGIPYSWYVTSKSNSVDKTAVSETWKFYNAGDGTINYAPFPAEAVNPINGDIMNAVNGKITLDWNAIDIDNDIASYDVYFGTETTPPSFKVDLTESVLTSVPVTIGSIYYWYIISKDKLGNTSKSEIFTFSVK